LLRFGPSGWESCVFLHRRVLLSVFAWLFAGEPFGSCAVKQPTGKSRSGGAQPGPGTKKKAALGAAFFFFYPISSEYQIRADLLPDLGRYFGVEVLLYHSLLLSFGREGLDRISTELAQLFRLNRNEPR